MEAANNNDNEPAVEVNNNGDDQPSQQQQQALEEEEEADEAPLPEIMGPNDPKRMILTRQERQWALDIKNAVEHVPELDKLNDFWYGQLAIICKEDVADAVARVQGLQHFRQEYDINDTLQDGCQALQGMIKLLPQHELAFGFSHSDGCYINVSDMAKYEPAKKITRHREEIQWFAGSYYQLQAINPDLESIRKGSITLVECEGMEFKSKPEVKLLLKMTRELYAVYPFSGRVRHYHTGVVYNLVASMMKKILPTDVADKFQVGLMADVSLDQLYLVPTPEIATQRLLLNMHNALKKRIANEKSFVL